jgi:hypothetical protein
MQLCGRRRLVLCGRPGWLSLCGAPVVLRTTYYGWYRAGNSVGKEVGKSVVGSQVGLKVGLRVGLWLGAAVLVPMEVTMALTER